MPQRSETSDVDDPSRGNERHPDELSRDPAPDTRPGEFVTAEVGSEGGSPGDLELERRRIPGTGSEGTELWRPGTTVRDVRRDEAGEGRRSPTEE